MKQISPEQLEKLKNIANNHIILDHDDRPFFASKGILKILVTYEAMKETPDNSLQNQIIQQLINIAHELDWAYFWRDKERHKKAISGLEEVKAIFNPDK